MSDKTNGSALPAEMKNVPVKKITIIVLLCWTLFLSVSLVWNLHHETQMTIAQATSEAEGHFNKDVVYRRWAALHGGVYVPTTEHTPPNPLLAQLPERDIETTSGRKLTLVNPAYMTRQVMELAAEQYGVRGHITSLNVIRPANKADDWEQQTLKAFEVGEQKNASVEMIDGTPYLRFMRPFITEASCLACHAQQGYKVGDIRGGISVSVPMDTYYQIRRSSITTISSWHLLTYLFGCGLITFGGRFLNRRVEENHLIHNELRINQDRFASLLTLAQMKNRTEAELVDFALAEAIRLSGSDVGYIHYYDEDSKTIQLFRWDDKTLQDCTLPDLSSAYPLSESGVWTDSIRSRKPVIHNDYKNLPNKKGLPEGHFPIDRHMSVPIVAGEHLVGLIGVGNKPQPYNEYDVTQVSLYATSVWEIIQNQRTLLALEKQEQQLSTFRALIDQSSDAIFIVSTEDGQFLDMNERAHHYLGYSRQEMLNFKVLDIDINQPENFNWSDHIKEVKKHRQFLIESIHQHKDGSLLPVEINVRVITLNSGEFMVAAVRDISARKQIEAELLEHRLHLEDLVKERTLILEQRTRELEESQETLQELLAEVNEAKQELEQANSKLQELDKLKSMFIASMSHELRTPLNAIIGFSSLILNGLTGEINEQQRDQLDRVYRSGRHLLSLITDVIDISKIESGRIQAVPNDFSLAELIDEACDSLKPQLLEKNLQLIKHETDQDITLHSDRKRLLQCLLNYLSNAVKFTEQGQIEIYVAAVDNTLTFCVTDSGIGIRARDIPLLFQSFVRLDSHLKTTTPGTGLGLYLTKKLVTEVLGGTVWAESTPGQGSRFCLKIPQRITS